MSNHWQQFKAWLELKFFYGVGNLFVRAVDWTYNSRNEKE